MSTKGAESPISNDDLLEKLDPPEVPRTPSPMPFMVSEELWQKAEKYFKENPDAIKLRGRDIPGIAFPKKPTLPEHTGQPDADKKATEAYKIALENYKKEKANYPSFLKIDGKIYAYSPLLGKGGMGKIKKAINKAGGQFALKILQVREIEDEEERSKHFQQLEIMRKIGYLKGYAVRIMEGEGLEKQYYITELRKGHDLAKELYEDPGERLKHKPISEKQKLFSALNSCLAIKELHDLDVIHCDIKPDNFMYENGRVKTIDFDLAKQLSKGQDFVDLFHVHGTPSYMAPEIQGKPKEKNPARYSKASDVYALGIMFQKDLNLDPKEMIAPNPKDRPKLIFVIENLCNELRKQPSLTSTEKGMLHSAECALITVKLDPIMKPATFYAKASIDWEATLKKAHEETDAGKIVKFAPAVHEALAQRLKRYKTSKAKGEDEIAKSLQRLIKNRDIIIQNLRRDIDTIPSNALIHTLKNHAGLDAIQKMIKMGEDASARDTQGMTMLMTALKNNHGIETIRYLMNAENAHVRNPLILENNNKQTPLMIAFQQHADESVLYLLGGSNLRQEDNQGRNALYYALQYHASEQVVRRIIQGFTAEELNEAIRFGSRHGATPESINIIKNQLIEWNAPVDPALALLKSPSKKPPPPPGSRPAASMPVPEEAPPKADSPTDADISSVSLFTWGTRTGSGNGMAHFLDSKLFGGNVGHASIAVTFPADTTGEELIRKYCYNDRGNKTIPFSRKFQKVLNKNNQVVERSVYTVYFSWWDSLNPTVARDNLGERLGTGVSPISPQFIQKENRFALDQLEQRDYRGALGSKRIFLSSQQIVHSTSLSEDQVYLTELERIESKINQNIEAINILRTKLQNDANVLKVEGTLKRLLDTHSDNWRELVKNSRLITREEIVALRNRSDEKIKFYQDQIQNIRIQKKTVLEKFNNDYKIKIQHEVNDFMKQLSTLPPEKQEKWLSEHPEMIVKQKWLARIEKINELSLEIQKTSTISTHLSLLRGKKNDFAVIQNALYDNIFPHKIDEQELIYLKEWRMFLPEQYKDISKKNFTLEILNQVIQNAKNQRNDLEKTLKQLRIDHQVLAVEDPFLQADYEHFVTQGHWADNRVSLPVSGITEREFGGNKRGLNVERMLKEMRKITDEGVRFDLVTKNCSVTTGAILAAGAEPALRPYLLRRAWGGGFGTPQEVHNGAVLYDEAISHGRKERLLSERLAEWNPLNAIEWAAGQTLKGVYNPNTSTITKIGLGIALVPLAVLAGASQTLKSAANPKKTFTNCTQFINYAWRNNSNSLKLLSVPVALLAGLTVIPAGLQHAAGKLVSGVSNLFKRRKVLSSPIEPVDTRIKPEAYQEITGPDPEGIINELSRFLKDKQNRGKIPYISPKNQLLLDEHFKTMDRHHPAHRAYVEKYEKVVRRIFKRVNHVANRQKGILTKYKTKPPLPEFTETITVCLQKLEKDLQLLAEGKATIYIKAPPPEGTSEILQEAIKTLEIAKTARSISSRTLKHLLHETHDIWEINKKNPLMELKIRLKLASEVLPKPTP